MRTNTATAGSTNYAVRRTPRYVAVPGGNLAEKRYCSNSLCYLLWEGLAICSMCSTLGTIVPQDGRIEADLSQILSFS